MKFMLETEHKLKYRKDFSYRGGTMERGEFRKIIEWDKKYVHHGLFADIELPILYADRTEGVYFYDEAGRKVLDFGSNVWCNTLGHRHPKIVQAIKEAYDKIDCMHLGFMTEYRAKAAKLIVEECASPWASEVKFTAGGGSEANEYALWLASVYTGRPYIVTRDNAFHGRTCGSGALTRMSHLTLTLLSAKTSDVRRCPYYEGQKVLIAPPPYCYRCPFGWTYPDCKRANGGLLACIRRTRDIIRCAGADTVAAIVTEVVFGVGGNIVPPPEYIPQLRDITKKLGVLWIDDEVICGFGRTGKWFAYQHYNVEPDMVTFAKGVTSAHYPLGGVIIGPEIAKWLEEWRAMNPGTYDDFPPALAAAIATIETIKEENILDHVSKVGRYLGDRLKELQDRHKCVGHVDGIGLMWSLHLVKNKETKEPIVEEDIYFVGAGDVSFVPTNILTVKCLEAGLYIAAFQPNIVSLQPPLTITEEEVDKGVSILDEQLKEIDKLCD